MKSFKKEVINNVRHCGILFLDSAGQGETNRSNISKLYVTIGPV